MKFFYRILCLLTTIGLITHILTQIKLGKNISDVIILIIVFLTCFFIGIYIGKYELVKPKKED